MRSRPFFPAKYCGTGVNQCSKKGETCLRWQHEMWRENSLHTTTVTDMNRKKVVLDHAKECLMFLDVFVRTLIFYTHGDIEWSLSHSGRDLRNEVENIQVLSQYGGGVGQGQLEQTINEEIWHVGRSPLSAEQELVIKVKENKPFLVRHCKFRNQRNKPFSAGSDKKSRQEQWQSSVDQEQSIHITSQQQ